MEAILPSPWLFACSAGSGETSTTPFKLGIVNKNELGCLAIKLASGRSSNYLGSDLVPGPRSPHGRDCLKIGSKPVQDGARETVRAEASLEKLLLELAPSSSAEDGNRIGRIGNRCLQEVNAGLRKAFDYETKEPVAVKV